jgi:hypothetical protein
MNYKIKLAIGALGIFCLNFGSFGQYQTIFQDTFSDSLQYRDLTKVNLWGTNSVPTSGFKRGMKADASGLSFMSIFQTDSAKKYSGYQTPTSLKAALAFDYNFSSLFRATDSMKLEFDVLWEETVSGGNPGRIVIALMHQNPSEIPAGAIVDSFQAKAPFGRPAYSFRILNRIPQGTNNYANMQYGGGKDSLGEFEKYSSGPFAWWLPGFISGPGGISPESSVDYPRGPVNRWRRYTLASKTAWRHFTWKIFPEKLEVWTRSSGRPEGNDTLTMAMVIPKMGPLPNMLSTLQTGHGLTNPLDSLPTLYHWFPSINGVRFYLNGGNITHLANVQLKSSYLPTAIQSLSENENSTIYPNPVSELLILRNETGEDRKILVLDGMGRKVFEGNATGTTFSLNTRSWNAGVYQIQVFEKGKKKNFRILKR